MVSEGSNGNSAGRGAGANRGLSVRIGPSRAHHQERSSGSVFRGGLAAQVLDQGAAPLLLQAFSFLTARDPGRNAGPTPRVPLLELLAETLQRDRFVAVLAPLPSRRRPQAGRFVDQPDAAGGGVLMLSALSP